MLNDRDIKKLIEVFITREEFKEAVSNLSTKKDISELHSAVDAYAKRADAYFQEMVMLSHQVKRHEKWLHQVADKLGIKLEY